MTRIVEVGGKDVVRREAVAEGFLALLPATIAAIREGKVEKGDVLATARVAGLQAAKRTPDMLPLCHPIPLTGASVDLLVEDDGIRARATVRAHYRTGVEMEALCAASVALLCAWDMVKSLEKDEHGQYPATRLRDLRVVSKVKGDVKGGGTSGRDAGAGEEGP